jgi:hypothetical protein
MKTNFLFLILTLVTVNSFGQITFEKGYFIDNQNQRVECLIKNNDWKDNPDKFEYKITENDNSVKGDMSTAKEFGIAGFSRYVRADVKFDDSPMGNSDLSKQREPEWSQKQLFLKVLVEGKATLYYYEGNALTRFFYSVPDSAIKQLIYKEFNVTNDQVAENLKFREQLWKEVRCAGTGTNTIEQLNYRKTDLEKYFNSYNKCSGNTSVVYGKKEKEDSFHLRITPGISFASMSISDLSGSDEVIDFGKKVSFSFGLDAEVILPFNKNKWGLIINPTYQYFNSSISYHNSTISADYKSVDFPVGLRYYVFLNQNIKLFANAEFILMSSISFDSKIYGMNVKTRNSYAFGGGVANKRLSAEIRFYTDRELLYDYISVNTDYTRLSVIFGYKIF